MPIYEYIAAGEDVFQVCRKGFELLRPADRAPLEFCPLCKAPVKKLVSRGVHSPKGVAKPFSVSEAKSAGFTILQRRDKDVFEKL